MKILTLCLVYIDGTGYKTSPNTQTKSVKVTSYQPSEKLFKRYINKINVEKYEGPALPLNVANHLIETNRRVEADR